MRYLIAIISLAAAGCGGSLSDEQRREMREKMELNKIIRVTEVEITEAAFAEGRRVVTALEAYEGDSARRDSAIRAHGGLVRYIRPGYSNARALEQQLVDAYLADASGTMQDNVQKVRTPDGDFDTLLYTMPDVTRLPDGSEVLNGIWNVWLPKKQLVLDISKKK